MCLTNRASLRCNECIHVTCHEPVWYNLTNGGGGVSKANSLDLRFANQEPDAI